MTTGNLSGANRADITNHQTQVLYEMNRDRILERLYHSEVLVNQLTSVIETSTSNNIEDNDTNSNIAFNLDTLVDNNDINLLNLDFKNSSKAKILTRSSVSPCDESFFEDEDLKTIEDLKISDGTLTTTFLSKLSTLMQHFSNLTKRVTDPNSKILICGDLNSGKSSFVNKLLNLKNIDGQCITSPIDQLPLTSIFIEFRHYNFNYLNKKPEIHAILKKTEVDADNNLLNIVENYDCMDPETYTTFELNKLEELVSDESTKKKYSLLVVYVNEDSNVQKDQSLLKNGVVDCSVIDSPGLNVDDFVTNDIFSKQETIDLIIFIINAENQLTLSGKDFISTAKAEKNFIFFIINKFDQIRDKERCSKLIMNQVQELTPLTYKQHDDFVHCVSSREDDSPGNSPNGNGDDSINNNNKPDVDFDKLRDSIKNFVVLKKSKNKLLPSQTFLNNLLRDLYFLTDSNIKIYNNRIQIVTDKIKKIRPEIDSISNTNVDVNKKIDYLIDNVIDSGYDFVKNAINGSLDDVTLPEYKGITNVYDYILENLECMNDKIEQSVIQSELYGKQITINAVSQIYDLNNIPENDRPIFDHDMMFNSRKKNQSNTNEPSLFKDINVWFELTDLFEPSWEGFVNFLVNGGSIVNDSLTSEKKTNDSEKMSFFTKIFSQFEFMYKNPALIFNSRIPTLALYSLGGSKIINNLIVYGSSMLTWNSITNIATTLLATSGCLVGAYLINDLPRALPYNLISKYRETLKDIDYSHIQAIRVTKDIRRILKIPQLELITKNNLKLFNIKEKEKNWQTILKKLNNNVTFLNEYQKEVVNEQQKLMEIVLELD
ncbi:hypothetical protein ACO0SA_004333 [Hanseniaspora valbyensis]